MNLIKLFNGKYLLQNLKKSKGLLTVLVLIIPVLTTLMLVSYNTSSYTVFIEEGNLSIINIVGMYIIPVIVSILLSGYIYKMNSVDFINSMPMNRKTIYFTNFVGGVLIILALQILCLITNIVCASIFTKLFIPISMIWDCFVVMLISYIFVFSVSMLAQTISGNILTQIVVTALILFLVPFTYAVFFNTGIYAGPEFEISYPGGAFKSIEKCMTQYTMPFKVVSTFFFANSSFYSISSILKMCVLSIIYLLLGMFLFEKRKMENIGTSFATMKVHYFVKALTLVPMVFLVSLATARGVYLVIAIILMFVYYVIYDFVLTKKVKVRYTIACFAVTMIALFGVYHGGMYLRGKAKTDTIPISDISGIAISDIDIYKTAEHNRQLDVFIEDSDLIQKICENSYEREIFYEMQSELLKNGEYYEYIMMRIKLKNGKDIYTYAHLNANVYDTAIAKLKEKQEYKDSFKFKEFAIAANYTIIPKEKANRVKEILEERYYDIDSSKGINLESVEAYIYDNHTMESTRVYITANQEICDIVVSELNKVVYEQLKKEQIKQFNIPVYRYTLNDDVYNQETLYMEANDKLINYMKAHYADKCDITKPIIGMYVYLEGNQTFYVNDSPELEEILQEGNRKWRGSEDTEVYE